MKTFLVTFLALVGLAHFTATAHALPSLPVVEHQLNNSATAGPASRLGTQVVSNKVQLLKCTYTVATQGGTTAAAINMKAVDGTNCTLPAGAIVKQVITHVIAAVTSGGTSTVAIGAAASNDLQVATDKGSLTLNALIAGVPVSTAATMVRLSSAKEVKVTNATTALDAGTLETFIEYYLGR